MKPLPPAPRRRVCRADISGSSGRGNGIRSITTSGRRRPARRRPARATACRTGRSPRPRRTRRPAAAVRSSPWHSTGASSRSRIASAAASAARIEENSPRVRPPAASTSSASLVEWPRGEPVPARAAAGAGRRTGCPAWGSRTASRRRARSTRGGVVALGALGGQAERGGHRPSKPAELEGGAGEHHRALAEQLLAQQPVDRQRRDPQHAAPRRRPGAARRARSRRTGECGRRSARRSCTRVRDLARAACATLRPGLLGILAPIADSSDACAARRRGALTAHPPRPRAAPPCGPAAGRSSTSARGPRRRSSEASASACPSTSRPRAAPPRSTAPARQLVGRDAGDPGDQLVRLVDDHHVVLGQHRDALDRVDREQRVVGDDDLGPAGRVAGRSAKHSSPNGHLAAPRHSRAVTTTCRQAGSETPGASSSRSPVSVSSAQSRTRDRPGPSAVDREGSNSARSSSSAPPPCSLLQAQVVGPALEHRVRRRAAEQRLERVDQRGAGHARRAGAAARAWRSRPRPAPRSTACRSAGTR